MIAIARLAGAAALAWGVVAGAAQAQTITFSSLAQGSLTYFQTTVMSKVLLDNTDLKIVVTPMQGPEAQIGAVNINDAQLMLTDATNATVAILGQETFKGRPQKNLRAIADLMPFFIGFVVKNDAPFKTVHDLKGKRLPAGWTAFRQSIALQTAVLGTAGLTMHDFVPVPEPEIIRQMDDFKAGRMDAALIAVAAPKVREVDAAIGGLRFLPIPYNPKTLAAVKKVRPDFYLAEVKPGPANVGVKAPMYLLAFDQTISTNASVPDAVVEKIAKAIHDHKKELAAGHPTFFGFNPDHMAKPFSHLRYHPGAIKYYKEIGIWPKS
jgi:uncharacterized protein